MTEQTFTSVMHWLDLLYKFWPIAGGFVLLGWGWWRTRSFFFIFHQALKWLGLVGKYSNPTDQKVADDYLDLNKFNLKTGFRLSTVGAKTRLHEWMQETDLEFAELRQAGWYFKANSLSFDLISGARLWFLRGVFITLGLVSLATMQFVNKTDYALLTVNATGTWFWAGKNKAFSAFFDFPKPFRGDAWVLNQSDCRYVDGAHPLPDIWEKNVICELVLGLQDDFVNSALGSQKWAALSVGLFGFACLAMLGILTSWQSKAKELHERISSHSVEDSEIEVIQSEFS